ncbi:helix-turn-helix domain-containing protein [Gordonia desulfuricans]|uniref:helix-turn-helix domain-containing protein n=1 Tax=Gordonia desulfuricans TaxID=89051 RepID=UPI001FD34B2D|nr:helix-turn-helix transcriptional regulator [Gordonia desulfuricans]
MRRLRRDAVGEAVRRARLSAGLNQQALADASGVSRPPIARIETGEASTQVDRLWILSKRSAQLLAESSVKQSGISVAMDSHGGEPGYLEFSCQRPT